VGIGFEGTGIAVGCVAVIRMNAARVAKNLVLLAWYCLPVALELTAIIIIIIIIFIYCNWVVTRWQWLFYM